MVTDISKPGVPVGQAQTQWFRQEVAKLLERTNTRFPGAQPVSFARKHLDELTRQEYVPHPDCYQNFQGPYLNLY